MLIKTLFAISFLIANVFTYADSIIIFERFNLDIPLLQGNSCEDINNKFSKLQETLSQLGFESNFRLEAPSCQCQGDQCLNAISGRFLTYGNVAIPTRTDFNFHGVNCWNTSLIAQGLVSNLRHVSHKEFSLHTNSANCKSVNESSAKPGDLIVIRQLVDNQVNELHAFTMIDPELGIVLSKNGYHTNEVVNLDSYEYVNNYYHTKDGCRGLTGDITKQLSNCSENIYSEILQCEFTPFEYKSNEAMVVNKMILDVEKQLNNLSLDKALLTRESAIDLINSYNEILNKLNKDSKSYSIKEKQQIEAHLLSITIHIYEFRKAFNI